jgi:hypothetical protein
MSAGALVRLDMAARVAVLLDNVPASPWAAAVTAAVSRASTVNP